MEFTVYFEPKKKDFSRLTLQIEKTHYDFHLKNGQFFIYQLAQLGGYWRKLSSRLKDLWICSF